jgi:hypothetical protein
LNRKNNFRLRLIFIFALITLNIYSEEETYKLKEKEVIGEDRRNKNSKLKDIKDIESVKKEENKIVIKEKKSIEPEIKEIKTVEKGETTENVIVTSNENRLKDNTIIFGLGGYRKIDSFKYIIDYTNEIKEKDITYYIHLGRDIGGEYRGNSDTGIDNYFGKIWYKNYDIGLYHLIKTYEYPGERNALSEIRSEKEEKSTELTFKYSVFSDPEKSLKTGFNIYTKNTDANSIEREFKNDYLKFSIDYDKIVEIDKYKNFLSAKGSYFTDKVKSNYFLNNSSSKTGKTGVFRAVLENKMKIKEMDDLSLILKGGVEFASKSNISDEKNFVLGVRGEKSFGEKFGIGAEFEKDSMIVSNKETLERFEIDSDIMPFKELTAESTMKLELYGYCNLKSIYSEAKVRYMNSNDRVYFEEGLESSLTEERVIYVKNYNKSLNWGEIELKGSHTYKNYRTELKYIYSTLDQISYSPKNRVIASLIYEYKKYKSYVDGKYYGIAYNKAAKDLNGNSNVRDKVCGAFTLDWKNSYDINEKTTLSFNILNLFDSEKEYKVNYPMPGRKLSFEIKIKY